MMPAKAQFALYKGLLSMRISELYQIGDWEKLEIKAGPAFSYFFVKGIFYL